MLEVTSIVIMSLILLGLTALMVVLFIKHLNVLYDFIEEILKFQTVLYQEIISIKLSLKSPLDQNIIKDSKDNDEFIKNINNTKKKYPLLDRRKIDTEVKEKFKSRTNSSLSSLESSEISDEDLSELIKGKELMFKKQVDVNLGDEFIDTDINI